MTKDELARAYKISPSTLRKLLNQRFYDDLKPLGYIKMNKTIPPIVVRKFIEIYDKPFDESELKYNENI